MLHKRTMHQWLLDYLCDPVDQSELRLLPGAEISGDRVMKGFLASEGGRTYSIINGIPRFITDSALSASVKSFGDEWNYFNYDGFKANWLMLVNRAFGSPEYFRDKLIVDCAAGSGMHTKWMSEYG